MPVGDAPQSFIPKQSLAPKGEKTPKKKAQSIFTSVGVIAFVLSVAAGGAVYGYELYVQKRIDNMRTSLERAKAAFEPALISELKQLNARLDSSQEILDEHLAATELFALLESLTLQTVQFDRMSFAVDDDNKMLIELSGRAESYSSVALQSDLFGGNKYIINPIFSGLGLDVDGNVTFSVSAEIDDTLLSYKEAIRTQ